MWQESRYGRVDIKIRAQAPTYPVKGKLDSC